jgi:BolA protein
MNTPPSVAQGPVPRASLQAIELALRDALDPSALEVLDDSHLHAGHEGARSGGHYTVRIVSSRFDGLSRVARHRLVYDALQGLIQSGIHALAIQARSPHD